MCINYADNFPKILSRWRMLRKKVDETGANLPAEKMSETKASRGHKKDKDSLSGTPIMSGLRSERIITTDVDIKFKRLSVSSHLYVLV